MHRTPKPTATYIRSLRLGSWAGFKHHLVRIGILKSPTDDCPIEWQRAFCEAFGRKLTK